MRQIIIFGDLQKKAAKELIDALPGEGKFVVVVKKYVKPRSLDQNAERIGD